MEEIFIFRIWWFIWSIEISNKSKFQFDISENTTAPKKKKHYDMQRDYQNWPQIILMLLNEYTSSLVDV